MAGTVPAPGITPQQALAMDPGGLGPRGLSGPVSTPSPPEINGQQTQPIWTGYGNGAYWTDPGKSTQQGPLPTPPGGGGLTTTPPPPPGTMPQPDMQYVNAFNASLGRQRQAIDNQFAASSAQLGARRDAAAAVVAGLPAQFAAHYKTAGNDARSLANTISVGEKGDKAIGANANDMLAASVLSGGNAAANSTIPVLNLANTQSYNTGEASLESAHMAATSALDAQAASFAASQASSGNQLSNEESLFRFEHTDPQTGVFTNPQLPAGASRNAIVPGTGQTMAQLNSAAVQAGFPSYQDQVAGEKAIPKPVAAQLSTLSHQLGTVPPANSPAYAAWVGDAFKIVEAGGIRGNRDAMIALASAGLIPEVLVPKKV